MQNHQCPKCGNEGECFSRDVSNRKDYYDEYIFICKKCHHVEKKKEWAGTPITWCRPTYCPFCGKSCEAHQETPLYLIK